MHTPDMFISGLGVYLPPTVSVELAALEGWYPEEEIELHELAGAAVADDMPAPEMALAAAQDAVKRSGRRPDEMDLLLYATTWHQGPEGWLPHSYLQRHLLGPTVPAVEIRQGCNGMFAALDLATGYLNGHPERQHALLVTADNYGTPLMDRWRNGPGFIGGDAAAALVLTKQPGGVAQLLSVCSANVPEAEELHRAGEPLFPPSITVGRTMSFSQRNDDFRRQAIARSVGTAALLEIQQRLMEVIDQALAESGITVRDVSQVAFMNYSREVVEQRCMAALDLPMSRSTWDFGRTIGHCGAGDQILALENSIATGKLAPGDHLLMIGTGPGVNVASAVIKVLAP